jgi:hypothetical protein
VFLDFHQLGVILFTLASVLSLLFVVAKPLGKEFEATALVWIRAFRRIQAEWRKPLTIEQPSEQSQSLNQSGSRHELGSRSP